MFGIIKPGSSRLSVVFALSRRREIQDFRSARGNVQDPVQGFDTCNKSSADAVRKPQNYTFGVPKRLKEKCTLTEISEFVKKSGESFQLVYDAMALRDGKALFKRS